MLGILASVYASVYVEGICAYIYMHIVCVCVRVFVQIIINNVVCDIYI